MVVQGARWARKVLDSQADLPGRLVDPNGDGEAADDWGGQDLRQARNVMSCWPARSGIDSFHPHRQPTCS